MPKKTASLLEEFGIDAHSADDLGWGGLANGALVAAAVEGALNASLLEIVFSANPRRAH